MNAFDWINLVSRWLHILAAATATGGLIFARLVVLPVLRELPEGERRQLHDRFRSRWARMVHLSIALLLLTGLYNIVVIERGFRPPALYHALFGVKFLLALAVFFLASMLVGRSAAGEKIRSEAGKWQALTLLLMIGIVLISGFLRSYHTQGLEPRMKPATEAAEKSPPR